MKLEVVSYKEVDQKKWDGLIYDESSNGEFINSREYLSYHPEGKFIDDSVAVIDSDSGFLRSLFPAASTLESRDILISHPGTTFAGIIFDTKQVFLEELTLHLELLLAYYKAKGFKSIEIRIPPAIYYNHPREDLFFLLWQKGFKLSGFHLVSGIYLKDIRNENDLLAAYMPRRRNQIRKLLKEENFIFRKVDRIDDYMWRSVTENLRERYKSKPTHTFEEISCLHSRFPEQIVPYVIFEKDTKEYAAFAVVYKFKKVIHTQYLDLNYKLSKKKPNLFLIHNLRLEALKENFNYFSLAQVTESWGSVLNKGLFEYKKQFGGGWVVFPKFEKSL
jgi:hypothetical protein